MPKRKKPTSLLSSSYELMGKIMSIPVDIYTNSKDTIRTIKAKGTTEESHHTYKTKIKEILNDMGVSSALKSQVIANIKKTTVLSDVGRTLRLLEVLHKHGLKDNAANQFFLGAHFKIDDGGALFEELKVLKGAETRFSSHFPDSRIEEKGITAGRVLPEILFLNSTQNGHTYSHFQVEASPWRHIPGNGLKNFIPELQTLQNMEHIYDSLIYFAAKKIAEWGNKTIYNRSNYGWSPFADNNPITSMNEIPEIVTEPVDEVGDLLTLDSEQIGNEIDEDEELENNLEQIRRL